ncbi:MAG: GNAT family N-acetyltransferase [bacterium]
MKLNKKINGPHIQLRTATEDDAEFILSLRLDPLLSRYIGKTDTSIEKQRRWLREKIEKKDDYHMIIETLKGQYLGVIALYNIDSQNKTFEWGRWIIKPDAPTYTAVESALLCYFLGFKILKLERSVFGVMKENVKTISFHKKFGASVIREEPVSIWFEYTKEYFEKTTQRYKRFI